MKRKEDNSVEEKLKNIGSWIEESGNNNFDDLENNNKMPKTNVEQIIEQSLNNYLKKSGSRVVQFRIPNNLANQIIKFNKIKPKELNLFCKEILINMLNEILNNKRGN